jgi:hypothetical protein
MASIPTVGRARMELRFLGPLHELVAAGLHRQSFEALCRGEAVLRETSIDRAYLLKVLDEEVTRPFGQPLRPVLELVLNGADAGAALARREGGGADPACRIVDVEVDDGEVTVTDHGEGMSVATILSRLLVPFATDRMAGVDIGRFGVGFFSVLGFGIADPASFTLHVETGDGVEGWSIRVVAGGRTAGSLIISLRSISPRQGTRVKIGSALLDATQVRSYLRDALHFFPLERAILRVDGVATNDGSTISGGSLFEDRVDPPDGMRFDPPLLGRFHLGGRALVPGITAATYHVGVKVEPCFAVGELALIDFPGAVELTEGRDAIKPGPAFAAVVAAFHRRLIHLGASATPATRPRIAELAAQISALMLQSGAWETVAPEMAHALLGEGRHLVSPDRLEALLGFFGPEIAARLFVPESFWAEREWHAFLPGERELLDDELVVGPVESLAGLARRRPDLLGLTALVARVDRPGEQAAALAQGRLRAAGPLPCLGTRRAVLIRADAPAVQAPRSWADVYALRIAFDRAIGLPEPDVERDLIVAAPIRTVGPITAITGTGMGGTRS